MSDSRPSNEMLPPIAEVIAFGRKAALPLVDRLCDEIERLYDQAEMEPFYKRVVTHIREILGLEPGDNVIEAVRTRCSTVEPSEHPPELMAVVDLWQDRANAHRKVFNDGGLSVNACEAEAIERVLADIRGATVPPKANSDMERLIDNACICRDGLCRECNELVAAIRSIQPPKTDIEALLDSFVWAVRRDNDAGDQYTRQEVKDVRAELLAAIRATVPPRDVVRWVLDRLMEQMRYADETGVRTVWRSLLKDAEEYLAGRKQIPTETKGVE
jgi:hypothetical protein